MRKAAFILFALGLALYVILPRIIGVKTGQTIVEAEVYEGQRDQWRPIDVDLSPAQNPVRIRVIIDSFPDRTRSVRFFDLVARITGPDGQYVDLPFTIRRDDGAGHNPADDINRSFALLPDLAIEETGNHEISLRQKREGNLNLKSVSIEIIGRGASVSSDLTSVGWKLMIGGIMLFVLSVVLQRRRSRRPPEPMELPGKKGKSRKDKKRHRKNRDDDDDDDDEDDDDDDDDHRKKANRKIGDIWTRAPGEKVESSRRQERKTDAGSIWDRPASRDDEGEHKWGSGKAEKTKPEQTVPEDQQSEKPQYEKSQPEKPQSEKPKKKRYKWGRARDSKE